VREHPFFAALGRRSPRVDCALKGRDEMVGEHSAGVSPALHSFLPDRGECGGAPASRRGFRSPGLRSPLGLPRCGVPILRGESTMWRTVGSLILPPCGVPVLRGKPTHCRFGITCGIQRVSLRGLIGSPTMWRSDNMWWIHALPIPQYVANPRIGVT